METSRMYIVDRGGGSYTKTSGGQHKRLSVSDVFILFLKVPFFPILVGTCPC